MKAAAPVLVALLVASTAACGGTSAETDPETAPPAAGAAPSESATTGGATPTAGATTSEGLASGTTVLSASVGTPDDPEAYVISLVDADGEEVTELPAGDYVVEVEDPSTIHNVHLQGPGVDEETTVPEVTTTQWQVTLEPGDYEYVCDPHPDMVGELTVT